MSTLETLRDLRAAAAALLPLPPVETEPPIEEVAARIAATVPEEEWTAFRKQLGNAITGEVTPFDRDLMRRQLHLSADEITGFYAGAEHRCGPLPSVETRGAYGRGMD